MVGVTPRIMCEGMRADYHRVDRLSQRLCDRMPWARRLTVRTAAGTNFTATFDPSLAWVKTSGLINPRYWSNLPAGEAFTTPASVDGTFVCDGTAGDYFNAKYGTLERAPLVLEIRGGRLLSATCDRSRSPGGFLDLLSYRREQRPRGRAGLWHEPRPARDDRDPPSGRESARGAHRVRRSLRQPDSADWSSQTHVDVLTRECDVWIDDDQVIEQGAVSAREVRSGDGLSPRSPRLSVGASVVLGCARDTCGAAALLVVGRPTRRSCREASLHVRVARRSLAHTIRAARPPCSRRHAIARRAATGGRIINPCLRGFREDGSQPPGQRARRLHPDVRLPGERRAQEHVQGSRRRRPSDPGAGPHQERRPEPRDEVRLLVARPEPMGRSHRRNPWTARRRRQGRARRRQRVQGPLDAGLRDRHRDPAPRGDQPGAGQGHGDDLPADDLQGADGIEHLQGAAQWFRAASWADVRVDSKDVFSPSPRSSSRRSAISANRASRAW